MARKGTKKEAKRCVPEPVLCTTNGESTLFHNRKDAIGHCLYDSFLFGRYFQPLETEIVPSVTRCLNRGTHFDSIAFLDFRIANNWSAANAQHCYSDGLLIVLKAKQVCAIASDFSIGSQVWVKWLHISYNASQRDMTKMIDPWFFEYLLEAGRFLCPHEYSCVCPDKRKQNDHKRTDDSHRSDHGG